MKIYPIVPIPKPRMTRADKWKKRDCVMRYRAFKDLIRIFRVTLPEAGAHVIFVIPMPMSWTKKKKIEMEGKPCRSKPDRDNLDKALCDAIYADDACVWDCRTTKIWGYDGKIIIREEAVRDVLSISGRDQGRCDG